MPSDRAFVLCYYRYDPLDRLVATSPSGQSPLQRFYCKTRLATEIQGLLRHTIIQHDDQLLAQLQRNGDQMTATLLATDQQRSVLHTLGGGVRHPIAYSPYGHHPADSGLLSLLGFNGERRDPVTGHYLLGNGYRAFNPVLMRFNSPDDLSPFGEGGLNSYMYCLGDPISKNDATGKIASGLLAKFNANKLNSLISDIKIQKIGIVTRSKKSNLGQLKEEAAIQGLGLLNDNRILQVKLSRIDGVGAPIKKSSSVAKVEGILSNEQQSHDSLKAIDRYRRPEKNTALTTEHVGSSPSSYTGQVSGPAIESPRFHRVSVIVENPLMKDSNMIRSD